jgi:hypothetical protein
MFPTNNQPTTTTTTSTSSPFPPQPIFGGAITCYIPTGFIDISQIREVPDNQEIYVDDVERMLSIEIMEHDHHEGNIKGDYLQRAYQDIAQANECKEAQIIQENRSISPEQAPGLLLVQHSNQVSATRVGVLLGIQTGIIKFHEQNTDVVGNSIRVWLAVIQLPQYNADVIISLTDPIFISETSSSAMRSLPPQPSHIADGMFSQILASFQIHDGNLFA